mgnify:CR=1 FL=1
MNTRPMQLPPGRPRPDEERFAYVGEGSRYRVYRKSDRRLLGYVSQVHSAPRYLRNKRWRARTEDMLIPGEFGSRGEASRMLEVAE